ncbi:MAG TPA: hypothetical protein VEZ89_02090, partial [Rubrivivax sp.]|nr:hypothetical protein [Rubrivivax sp.]
AAYASLHAPRLLGHLAARTPPGAVLAESAFLLLFDGLIAFDKTLTALGQLAGWRRAGWPAQRRDGQGVGWGEAWARLWPHTAMGLAILALLASGSGFAVLAGLPAVAGLVLAVPFCVWTAGPHPPVALVPVLEPGPDAAL